MSKKVGIILFPAYDWQISDTHPERAERLLYTSDQLLEEGLDDLENIKFYKPKVASFDDIKAAHFVIPNIEKIVEMPHLISAGAAIKAIDLVMTKEVDKAFSISRPPGHHAMEVVLGNRGFCVINNVAVMVEYLRNKYGNLKIAIVDTDCHHGDGTENIYYNDPNVLFISVHQHGETLYPGTGFIPEQGGPSAFGYNINIPLYPKTTDEGYLFVAKNVVKPILDNFNPDIIIQSAGQDNHYSDPLTNMRLSAQGYAKLTEIIDADVLILEGGYAIEGALPYLNLAITLSLAGLDYSNVIEPDFHISKIKQENKITNYINVLSKDILTNWINKDNIKPSIYKDEDIFEETKRIYYDTSNIAEQQYNKYYLCKSCSGVKTIQTNGSNGVSGFLVHLPIDACHSCETKAYQLYEQATNKIKHLKDRKNNRYL